MWYERTLGELCGIGGGRIQTGPFGSQLHQSDYDAVGTPVVMPTNIKGGRIDTADIARVSESHVHRLRRHKLALGDIVYGRRGDIGRQAITREENVGWLCGTGCLRVSLGDSEVRSDFLHRYLATASVIGWIQGQAIGATMPNLNTSILERVPVRYPDLPTQEKIVATLAAYDDLIETNTRRIALLERMAEQLYREWFVRMRFPGHEEVEFEKGAPIDWKPRPIDSLCKEIRSGVKKEDLSDDERYVGSEHIPRRSIALKESATADTVTSNKFRFRERDILFGKIRPYLHKIVLSHFAGACSTDIIVIRPIERKFEGYLLFTIFSDSFVELATIAATGTKMPRADWRFLKKQELRVPNDSLLKRFQSAFEPIYEQIVSLMKSNESLVRTRDLLLPRLISGKLSVEDLDIHVPPSMRKVEEESTELEESLAVEQTELFHA